jgi:hypothetical protein
MELANLVVDLVLVEVVEVDVAVNLLLLRQIKTFRKGPAVFLNAGGTMTMCEKPRVGTTP